MRNTYAHGTTHAHASTHAHATTHTYASTHARIILLIILYQTFHHSVILVRHNHDEIAEGTLHRIVQTTPCHLSLISH
jgi:hypothetical protein